MRWGFWISLRGSTKLWAASTAFIIIGALVAFVMTAIMQPGTERDLVLLLLRVLGGTFIVLGFAIFLPMVASLFVEPHEKRKTWYWWLNFIGGLLGALAFAIPATLIFPVFFAAFLLRPNGLVPADSPKTAENLWVALFFSFVGILTLFGIYFIGREQVKQKPQRGDSDD